MSQPDSRPPLPYVHVVDVAVRHPSRAAIAAVCSQGTWWLPGGRVEDGETFPEAAVREVAEETGLVVEIAGIIGVTERFNDGRHEVFVTMAASVVGGELAVPSEDPKITGVEWVEIERVPRQLAHYEVLGDVLESPVVTAPHYVE